MLVRTTARVIRTVAKTIAMTTKTIATIAATTAGTDPGIRTENERLISADAEMSLPPIAMALAG